MGITLPANLNVYVSAALFVLGAYLFALYLGLVVWTFRDVHSRSRDVLAQIMATLLVAVFTVPGWLIYLLLRSRTTLAEDYERQLAEEAMLQGMDEQRLCPKCQRRIEPDYVLCPYCHHALRAHCQGCGRLMDLTWNTCPYCGQERQEEKEAQPALPATETDPALTFGTLEVETPPEKSSDGVRS